MEEKIAKKQTAKDEYAEKVKALLDDEQNVKYDAMKAEYKKGSMKGSGHEHKGSGHEMKGSDSDSEAKGSDSEMKGSGSEE